MRILIIGWPKTGKTTLAEKLSSENHCAVYHSDQLINLGWSEASQYIADYWLTLPGDWIIEGVAIVRALRKWCKVHPVDALPFDQIIKMSELYKEINPRQMGMGKGHDKVWREVIALRPDIQEMLIEDADGNTPPAAAE